MSTSKRVQEAFAPFRADFEADWALQDMDWMVQHYHGVTDDLGVPVHRRPQLLRELASAWGISSKSRTSERKRTFQDDVALERERAAHKITSGKYKEALKYSAKTERLLDVVHTAIKAMPPVSISRRTTAVKRGATEHTAAALLSDVHVGEVVSASELAGLGHYDMDEFHVRVNRWAQKLLELVELRRSRLYIPTLEIFALGDIVSGEIHQELIASNEVGVVDQVVIAAAAIASAVGSLAEHFERIIFTGVVGNHGRMAPKPYFKGKQRVNWDYMVYQMIASHLKAQKNVEFHIPDSFFTIRNVLGTRFLLIHGDTAPSSTGVPYYGIERMALKLRQLVGPDVTFDRVVLGHYHDPVDTERWHINGSFKGADEFAVGKLFAGGRPSQTLIYVHPKHGVVGTERLYLDEGDAGFQEGLDHALWREDQVAA